MIAALLLAAGLGPAAPHTTELSLLGGDPLSSLHLDHGFGLADAGVSLDISREGFVRPGARTRLRLFVAGPARMAVRFASGVVLPAGAHTTRPVLRTLDGEAGLVLDVEVGQGLVLSGELSTLVETDFTAEHSALFTQEQAGLWWGAGGPVALVARVGRLAGNVGSALIWSAGVALTF